MHVLVVDDVPDTLDLMRRLLIRAGYEVAIASSAGAAINAAQARPPDVIITDIGMPGCDGFELLRRLNAQAALANVPAIAVSGFTGDHERTLARDSGFGAYLTKPIDVPLLLQTLDSFLPTGRKIQTPGEHAAVS